MALITDPDSLSQGTLNNVADLAFTVSSGANTTLTGAATLPALATGEFFEIRSSNTPGNDGLYIATGTPTTSSVSCTKVVGANPVNDTASSTDILGTTGASTEKSVHFDTPTLTIYLLEQGNLSVDGVIMLAFHSFAKEEWKSDAFLIAAAAFPMVGISFAAGQWQFGVDPSGNNSGWKPAEDNATHSILTRRLFRNAGWDEIDSSGNTLRKYFNVTTLGTFEDSTNDLAYYRFGTDATDLAAAVDYEFAGPVNEPVKYFEEFGNPPTCDFATSSTITRASGSFVTDGYQVGGQVTVRGSATGDHNGTFVLTGVAALTLTVTGTPFTTGLDTLAQLAVDNSNAFQTFIRVRDADPNGKTFEQSNLAGAGETGIISKIIKFPLANDTDVDISETDANIDANSPYTSIVVRYFDQAFNREVDSATNRDFGIAIDVGTHSGVDGSAPGAGSVLTTAEGGMTASAFVGGTLRIHEGTDENTEFPITANTTTTITVTGTIASGSNLSFTAQLATPVVATKNEIYEKVHRLLRQDVDIDSTDQVITGRTADDLLTFVGADLRAGEALPTNPNGGGSGVIIEGFDANDTNNLFFFDNTGTSRNFPFVAAGTLVFNQGLVDDTDGEYWLYFEYTTRTNLTDAAVVTPSGDTYDLESPGSNLPALSVNDHIFIPAGGFADEASNGLFIVEVVNVSTSDYTIRKLDGTAVGAVESGVTIDVDQNPYPSPDAIIVDNNAGADIAGAIGATAIAFDFDYDNNVQGGRTAATNAAVVLVAAGLETGQVAVAKNLTITRATGLSFSITSALERNYSNP